ARAPERGEELRLDPAEGLRSHVVDAPGENGAAFTVEPALELRLEGRRQDCSRQIAREDELGRCEALEITAVGAAVDRLGVTRLVPGRMIGRDHRQGLAAAGRQRL